LNYTSIGCAGFSALTPYASYFRLLTGGFVTYLLWTHGLTRRTFTTAALSGLLIISQDLVKLHNSGELGNVQQVLAQYGLLPAAWKSSTAGAPIAAHRILLQVQGMRCESCAARLRGNLQAVQGIDSCTVKFSAGTVEVWSNGTQPVPSQALLQAVEATDSSYIAKVLERQCFDARENQQPCPAERQHVVDEL
jgi:copper chaperone CopZ